MFSHWDWFLRWFVWLGVLWKSCVYDLCRLLLRSFIVFFKKRVTTMEHESYRLYYATVGWLQEGPSLFSRLSLQRSPFPFIQCVDYLFERWGVVTKRELQTKERTVIGRWYKIKTNHKRTTRNKVERWKSKRNSYFSYIQNPHRDHLSYIEIQEKRLGL